MVKVFCLFLAMLLATLAFSQETTSGPRKQFSRIWVRPDIVPMNFSWQDLGPLRAESFTGPLGQAWKKWVQENMPPTVGDSEICSGDCLSFSEQWESRPQRLYGNVELPEYSGSLWLKLSVNIWRKEGSLEGPAFRWEGRAVLLDITTKRVMGIVAIRPREREFQGLIGHELNSALGNQIYRSVLSSVEELFRVLEKAILLNNSAVVNIRGHRHLLDALALVRLLQSRGAHLALGPLLESFTQEEAHFICFYQGEEKSFTDLLSGLKRLKSSESYGLVTRFTGSEHMVQMVAE